MILPEESRTPPRVRLVAGIVAIAFFMQNLDGTIITTSLPAIARDYRVAPLDMTIGITAYLMAVAAMLPAAAWLAERFGGRTVFAGAVAIFTLASVLCALSPNLAAFVAARLLQGAAGALTVPVGRILVLRNARPAEMLDAIATITWPGLIAPVLGPPLGGFITAHAAWQWIFLINVPIGLTGLVLALALIPNDRAEARRPFDLVGFAFSGVGLTLVVYCLQALSEGRAPWLALGGLVAGVLAGTLAILRFRNAAHPLISLAPLKAGTFLLAVLGAGLVVRIAINATPFLLPLMFQIGWGYDPFSAGMLVLVYMGGNLLMKTVTTPILRRFGFRPVMVANGAIVAASIAGTALLAPGVPLIVTGATLLIAGMARSMQFTGLANLTFADIAPEERAHASTISEVTWQSAQTFGVAIGAGLLSMSVSLRHGAAVATGDFAFAFVVLGVVALGALVGFLRMPADAGARIAGKA